jgi:hypothetical protein
LRIRPKPAHDEKKSDVIEDRRGSLAGDYRKKDQRGMIFGHKVDEKSRKKMVLSKVLADR